MNSRKGIPLIFFLALISLLQGVRPALSSPVYDKNVYARLEGTPVESQEFPRAVLDLQKLHYSQKDWGRFFAYAAFYRNYLLKNVENPEALKIGFKGRLFSLEALALGKHCLWDQARSIAQMGTRLAEKLDTPHLPELEHTLELLRLMHHYPLEPSTTRVHPSAPESPLNSRGTSTASLFSSIRLWPIDAKRISAVKHPKFLRLSVANHCAGN